MEGQIQEAGLPIVRDAKAEELAYVLADRALVDLYGAALRVLVKGRQCEWAVGEGT